MKDFKFLLKPVFYIFNILFASWLVIKIETLHPSDFGRKSPLFDSQRNDYDNKINTSQDSAKDQLKHLFRDFNTGTIDSVKLDEELTNFLKRKNIPPSK